MFGRKKLERLMFYLTNKKEDCLWYDESASELQKCFYYFTHGPNHLAWDFHKCEGVCKNFKSKGRTWNE